MKEKTRVFRSRWEFTWSLFKDTLEKGWNDGNIVDKLALPFFAMYYWLPIPFPLSSLVYFYFCKYSEEHGGYITRENVYINWSNS